MSDSKIKDERAHKVFINGFRGMMLVAFEEGEPHWRQKVLLMESIRMIKTHFTAEEGLIFVETIATSLEDLPDFKCAELFESASDLSDYDKRTILSFCITMAFEDWKLSEVETELIIKIADWIKINLSNRQILVNDIIKDHE